MYSAPGTVPKQGVIGVGGVPVGNSYKGSSSFSNYFSAIDKAQARKDEAIARKQAGS